MSLEEQSKIKLLLTEAIAVLCRNGLTYQSGLSIEGLLGITLDNQNVFLISLNETIEGSSSSQGRYIPLSFIHFIFYLVTVNTIRLELASLLS